MQFAAFLAVLGIVLMPTRVVEQPTPVIELPFPIVQTAQALETPPETVPIVSTSTLMALATSTAAKYHVNVDHFLRVISCESGWDPSVQSKYLNTNGPNGRENSWGIAQINLDKNNHPDITKEEALDPAWALDWMAREWVAGRAREWTCWRIYFG